MSQSYPPPGAEPHQGPPPPGMPPPARPDWAVPPPGGMPGAAHKPGAIPLRPLGLGDLYDGAFRVIRFNPKATVGSAVLVASVAMAIPILVTTVLSLTLDLSMSSDPSAATSESLAGVAGAFGALGFGTLLQGLGLVLVTGMIAHVAMAAATGRRLSLGEAWTATRGKRWRLIGLVVLLALMMTLAIALYAGTWVVVVMSSSGDGIGLPLGYGLVSVPLFLAFLMWFWIRVYYLPVPALMLEDRGVWSAIGRGYALTRRHFWRTFGIALLTLLIAQVAGAILSTPISLVGQLVAFSGGSGETGLVLLMVSQAVSSVISAAFVAPFTTTVTSLQYIDLRMRKEGFDVELMQRAGITGA